MKSLFSSIVALLILMVLVLSPPVMAQQTGANAVCPLSVVLNTATANTQLIAAPAANTTVTYINGTPTTVSKGKAVHICNMTIVVKQAVGAANFGLISGTGTVCATGTANLTPQYLGTASVVEKVQEHFNADGALVAPAGKAVCLKLSATPTDAQVLITYNIGN
jgi:hypothetical protein